MVKSYPLPGLHPKKAFLYNMACPKDTIHQGELTVAQYRAVELEGAPKHDNDRGETVCGRVTNVFTYRKSEDSTDWWVNFTGNPLFIAYSGEMFLQDEVQVAEHPTLAHLNELLLETYANTAKDKPTPLVARFNNKPCPVLIRGVERRLNIDLAVSLPAELRHFACPFPRYPVEALLYRSPCLAIESNKPKVYGHHFSTCTEDDLWTVTDVLEPSTISNIICMAARCASHGAYKWEELVDLYETAFTAFRGARKESKTMESKNPHVTIHTGHWGCGAFGGNKMLMVLIQQQAATDAGIDRLVYYTVDECGTLAYENAIHKRKLFMTELKNRHKEVTTKCFLERLLAENYQWCEPDLQ